MSYSPEEGLSLSATEAHELLKAAVAERGADYVYPGHAVDYDAYEALRCDGGPDAVAQAYSAAQIEVFERAEEEARTWRSHASVNGVCRYVVTPEDATGAPAAARPGCIIGEVLHRVGVPLDVLADWEGRGAREVLNRLHRNGEIPIEVKEALRNAQQVQDNDGGTWGEALARFELMLNLLPDNN